MVTGEQSFDSTRKTTQAQDMWSLGCLLVYMLTATDAFWVGDEDEDGIEEWNNLQAAHAQWVRSGLGISRNSGWPGCCADRLVPISCLAMTSICNSITLNAGKADAQSANNSALTHTSLPPKYVVQKLACVRINLLLSVSGSTLP